MNEKSTTSTNQSETKTREIPLTRGYVAIVDEDDYERVSQWKWTALPGPCTVYARRGTTGANGKQKSIYLHRFIVGAESKAKVDHKDHNGLNNTKDNLRTCTHAQNCQHGVKRKNNTSGYKGVAWQKTARKWQANITVENKQVWLGNFNTKEEAYAAYCAAAKIFHREFHKLE